MSISTSLPESTVYYSETDAETQTAATTGSGQAESGQTETAETTGAAAQGSAASTVIETPASESLLSALAAEAETLAAADSLATVTPMAATATATTAASVVSASEWASADENYILANGTMLTFTSVAQARAILGLDATQLPDGSPLTYMVIKNESTSDTKWLPVTLKRNGKGNFLNQEENTVTPVAAGAIYTSSHSSPPSTITVGGVTKSFEDYFLALHSADQTAILIRYGLVDTSPPALYMELPAGSSNPTLTAVLNDAGTKPIILEQLDSQAIGLLSESEQAAVVDRPGFANVALKLGLSTTVPASLTSLLNTVKNTALPAKNGQDTNFTATQKQMFLDEINLLISQVSAMSVFLQSEIDAKAADILERFDRALAYGSLPPQPEYLRVRNDKTDPDSGISYYTYTISSDDNALLIDGAKNYYTQEERLLELGRARDALASTHTDTYGKKLDVPSLVYMFQLYYMLDAEAQIEILSEDVEQQNGLLKTYNEAQIKMNETIGIATNSGNKIRYMNTGYSGGHNVSAENAKPISMFMKILYSHNGSPTAQQMVQPAHPLETLRGITRPQFEIVNNEGQLIRYKSSAWSNMATQLSDAVTVINQETQIQMNAISTAEKEKNRYFEMANNALSKLNEVVQSIARAV